MFPFLRLPPEIRGNVYQYCLVANRAIDLCCLRKNPKERPRPSEIDIHPCILQSNRQIYIEAIDVLYGQNFFYINPVAGLEASESTQSCLACCAKNRALPEDTSELGSSDRGWTNSTRLVRRLIVLVSPYTLMEWNSMLERQQISQLPWCSHAWHHVLPPSLDLHLTVLHRGQRSLMHHRQAANEDNW